MALGQNEPVAIGIVHAGGPEIEFGAVETSQNIGTGQRAARMAGAGVIDRGDRVLAHEARGFFEVRSPDR